MVLELEMSSGGTGRSGRRHDVLCTQSAGTATGGTVQAAPVMTTKRTKQIIALCYDSILQCHHNKTDGFTRDAPSTLKKMKEVYVRDGVGKKQNHTRTIRS